MKTVVYSYIKRKQVQIEGKIAELNEELMSLPPGKLLVLSNGRNRKCKWFKIIDGRKVYIKASQVNHARQLARRRYIECIIKDLKQELYSIQLFLNHHKHEYECTCALLNKNGYKELLEPYLMEDDARLTEWAKAEYRQLDKWPEEKIHKAADKKYYRSKQEAFIASELYRAGIPFRYEEEMILSSGQILHPDFRIMHPVTREIFIWEHLGLLSKASYRHASMSKLVLYGEEGYILNENLIITTESETVHLDVEEIEEIISNYFL